jgi:excisionase family DNA binding protein
MGRIKGPQLERMLTVADAADLFSVHKRTIQREIERGNLLPAVMVSGETRLPISTLRHYIAQRMIRPAVKGAQP